MKKGKKEEPLLHGLEDGNRPLSLFPTCIWLDESDPIAATQEDEKVIVRGGTLNVKHAFRLVCTVHGLSAIYGLDMGITSGVLLWADDKGDDDDEGGIMSLLAASALLRGFLVSILSFGCVFGCFVSKVDHGLGVREDIRLGAAACFFGSLVEALTSFGDWNTSAAMVIIFCIGRFVAGIGVGVVMFCIPIYVGELAPPAYRGMLNSLEEVAIVLGLTLGYIIGVLLSHPVGGYIVISAICAACGIGMSSLPPSPSSVLRRQAASQVRKEQLEETGSEQTGVGHSGGGCTRGGGGFGRVVGRGARRVLKLGEEWISFEDDDEEEEEREDGYGGSDSNGGSGGGGGGGGDGGGDRDEARDVQEVLAVLRFLNSAATAQDVQLLIEDHFSVVDEAVPVCVSSQQKEISTATSPSSTCTSSSTVSLPTSSSTSVTSTPAPISSTSIPDTSQPPSPPPRLSSSSTLPLGGRSSSSSSLPRTSSSLSLPPSSSSSSLLPPALLKDSSLRLALRISVGIVALQILSGMPALMYYASVLLDDVDLIKVWIGLALIGIIKLSLSVFVTITVDWYGRKTLLECGMFGLFIGMALFAGAAYVGMADDDATKVSALVGFYLAVAAYEVGVGPICWVLIGEMFPSAYKKEASALCIMVNFSCSAILTLMLPIARAYVGWSLLFTDFALVSLAGLMFVHYQVVETSQLSLSEIQAALGRAAKKADRASATRAKAVRATTGLAAAERMTTAW